MYPSVFCKNKSLPAFTNVVTSHMSGLPRIGLTHAHQRQGSTAPHASEDFFYLPPLYIFLPLLVVIGRERLCERVVGAKAPEYIIVRDVTIGIGRRFCIPIVLRVVKLYDFAFVCDCLDIVFVDMR